jgi:hypothetical protein
LWPAAVAWVGLGVDSVSNHVSAGSLLVLLAAATALEAWWGTLQSKTWPWVLALAATPLVWVHARSTYLDLPMGLLSAALLGFALTEELAAATVLAVVLCAFKDEGIVHVLAASAALWLCAPRRSIKWLAPGLAGATTTALWRALTAANGITNVDHSVTLPAWRWSPDLVKHLALHASDVWSWGLFWGAAGAALVLPTTTATARALRWALGFNVALSSLALLSGPEQVRAFAENGTLINRLLMQWWPLAAVLVLTAEPVGRVASRSAISGFESQPSRESQEPLPRNAQPA